MTEDDKIEIRQKIIFFVGLSILFITAVIFSIYTLDNFFNFGVELDLEDWIFLIFSIIIIFLFVSFTQKMLRTEKTNEISLKLKKTVKIILSLDIVIIFLILFSIYSTPLNAAPSLNEQLPSKQQIVIDDTMNELIVAGYVLQTQETRGIITVYVLKKGDEFASCRVERSIKKQIEKCYIIELVNNQNK